jgi:hypothetical protein
MVRVRTLVHARFTRARYEPWLINEHEKREQDLFPVPEMIDRLQADKTNFGSGQGPVTERGRDPDR